MSSRLLFSRPQARLCRVLYGPEFGAVLSGLGRGESWRMN